MPGILNFLKSNPELAFKLLQVGGGGLAQVGGQFDQAQAYNSQNRANRRNSLVGALSMGQVPGTAQGTMPGPGFLSTLGQGAGMIGEMGGVAFDLKRQKADEEYQKKMRDLQVQQEALSIDVLEQDKQRNASILAEDKDKAGRSEGMDLFNKSYAVGLRDHKKRFTGAKVSDPPPYNPANLLIPDEILTEPNKISGWQMAYEKAFDTYHTQENTRLRTLVDKQQADTARVNADMRLAEAERRGDVANGKLRNDLSKQIRSEAGRLSKVNKIPDTEDSVMKILAAYNHVNPTTGAKEPLDALLIKSIERFVNEGNQVTLQEYRQNVADLMPLSGQILQDWLNLGKLPDDMPMKLNDAARNRIMDYARETYDLKARTYQQQLDQTVEGFAMQAMGSGLVYTPAEMHMEIKSFAPRVELLNQFAPTEESQVNLPAISKIKQDFDLDRQQRQTATSPDTTSVMPPRTPEGLQQLLNSDSTSTLHGGPGAAVNVGEDPNSLMTRLVQGGLGYGAYKMGKAAMNTGKNMLNFQKTPPTGPYADMPPPTVPDTPTAKPTGPGIFNYKPTGPFGDKPPAYDPNGPAMPHRNTYDPNFKPLSGKAAAQYGGSLFPSSTGSSMYDAADMTQPGKGFDFTPPQARTTPDISVYNKFKFNSTQAGNAAKAVEQTPVTEMSPSMFARAAKNPALAKALGILDVADKYAGGFAGGMVNTKMIQDYLNKVMYGPRGYD